MVRKLTGVVFAISAMHAAVVNALGLGEIELRSALNQPLQAEINLLSAGDLNPDQIQVKIAGVDDFERAGVDRGLFLSDLRFRVELDGRGNGVVKVNSSKLVREPFLNFVLEARWPSGRLLREYTLLMDIPAFTDQAVATPKPAVTQAAVRPAPAARPSATRSTTTQAPAASSQPLPEGSYKTQGSDTLWGIASSYRPANASVQQTMMAIYEKNPEAFNRGNINGLKRGQVLEMPSHADIQAMSRRQAVQAASEQNKAWSSGATLAAGQGEQAARTGTAGNEARLKLASTGTEDATSGGTAGSGGDQSSTSAMRGELAAAEENLDRVNRENAELESRMNDLSEQVETLQSLVELKDNQLNGMQQRLGEEAPETQAPATDGESGEEAVDLNFAEESAAESAAETELAADSEVESVEEPVLEPRKPATPVVTIEQEEKEEGLVSKLLSPLYLGLIGLAIAAITALVVMRKRRQQADVNDEPLDFTEFDADAIGGGLFADDEPLAELDDTVVSPAVADEEIVGAVAESTEETTETTEATEAEPEDPVAEAEIYCSYNRYDEAIELLEKAIGKEPDRAELHLKLLSIFADQDQQAEFSEAYSRLAATGNQDSLHLAQELVSGKDNAAGWTGEDAASPGETVDLDAPASDEFDLEIDLADDAGDVTEARPALGDLELEDLDLADSDLQQTADATEASDSDDSLEFDVGDLDLELDDAPELKDEDIVLDLSADLEPEAPAEADIEEDFSIDAPDDLGDLELELDSDDSDTQSAESALADIDNILESSADIDDDLGDLAEGDEVATKLDLARAYIDMGDVDGARDILDEVIQEGSDDQKDEASGLLNNLAG